MNSTLTGPSDGTGLPAAKDERGKIRIREIRIKSFLLLFEMVVIKDLIIDYFILFLQTGRQNTKFFKFS